MTENSIQTRSNEDGFTLVEVMVTLVIIGLLTTFVVLNVLPAQGQAKVQKARSDIALIETGLDMYALDLGGYPSEARRPRRAQGRAVWALKWSIPPRRLC